MLGPKLVNWVYLIYYPNSLLNNGAKSALRFTRESELLGGTFESKVTRDALILNTTF